MLNTAMISNQLFLNHCLDDRLARPIRKPKCSLNEPLVNLVTTSLPHLRYLSLPVEVSLAVS